VDGRARRLVVCRCFYFVRFVLALLLSVSLDLGRSADAARLAVHVVDWSRAISLVTESTSFSPLTFIS
jgi:hypothetical protein